MGIKYAFLVGLITGLFNIIPYIGVLTALILSAVITFATAAVTSKVILVIITLVIVHLIDSNVLLPVIVGSSKPFQCLLKSQLNLSGLLCFNRTITTN
ncbi:AI-2E family transporter [Mucilaginibacter sp. PAMB04274]|uniref:AI-2E family transporter n=1 Tax=Mucilaginibacter sp. PAMB04274 TaxID=3138568 RepID=UPI0031F60EFE